MNNDPLRSPEEAGLHRSATGDSDLLSRLVPGRETSVRELAEALQTARQHAQQSAPSPSSCDTLAQVINAVPQAVFWKDCESVFLGCNESFARFVGLENPAQVIGKNDFDFPFANIRAAAYRQSDREVIAQKKALSNIIEPVRQADGSDRWVSTTKAPLLDASGCVCGVVGVFDDITERRQTQENERAARQRLALLVQQSPMAVVEWDLEFCVTEWNAAAERMFGYARAEALGKKGSDLISPPELREQLTGMFKTVLSQEAGAEIVNDNITRDNRRIICEWRNTALVDESGQTIGIASLIHDITDRTRNQEQRQKLETQMQQVQKLESLGVLAGGIAHDFNNLLMCILGNADLALADLPPMSPGREHIREIERASRRAADLCRQMLAYSGKGRFVVETVSLSELVEEMVHLLRTSISKKAILNLNLEKSLPHLRGDSTQVRQIVMNLVINASEAIADRSGVITISTGAMECTPEYLREAYLDDNLKAGFYVWLEVSDTGCGMDSATVHRIFEPFFTTKFTGRGLGLSAVLGIVRGHKGALKVYSEPGKGTTFKVLFPASEENPAIRKPAREGANDRTFSGTVLLVDDEETIRATGKMMLERMGYKVLVAVDGREAIKIYPVHSNEITVVLLDLTMPHLNGEETFRELRQMNPQVRVIMSSGYSEMDISSRFAGKGLAGFIQKPYTRAELTNCLSSVAPESQK